MQNIKFNVDFNNKHCYTFISGPIIKKPLIAFITLWKPNNRLSHLRCLQFLEKFISNIYVKNITTKTRTGKIKNYSRYYFNFSENLATFLLLKEKLPEAEITLQQKQYVITYNFYRFLINIPISHTDVYNLTLMHQISTQTVAVEKNNNHG